MEVNGVKEQFNIDRPTKVFDSRTIILASLTFLS